MTRNRFKGMMSSEFVLDVLEMERTKFSIKTGDLNSAIKDINIHDNQSARNNDYIDYNKPVNCCAYIYRYSFIHSNVLSKIFLKLMKKKVVKNSKKDIKICCLGGGSGTNVVGILKVLACFPAFQHRVSQISVLDKCEAWSSSFENVMNSLVKGKLKKVPTTTIKRKEFTKQFIKVDLLGSLPTDAVKAISTADVITMVKFLSEVGTPRESYDIFQKLGQMLKPKAIIIYVDKFETNMMDSLREMSPTLGLEFVIGPLGPKRYKCSLDSKKMVYDYDPQFSPSFSVAVWIKTDISLHNGISNSSNSLDAISDIRSDTGEWYDNFYSPLGWKSSSHNDEESIAESLDDIPLSLKNNDSSHNDKKNIVKSSDEIPLRRKTQSLHNDKGYITELSNDSLLGLNTESLHNDKNSPTVSSDEILADWKTQSSNDGKKSNFASDTICDDKFSDKSTQTDTVIGTCLTEIDEDTAIESTDAKDLMELASALVDLMSVLKIKNENCNL